MSKREPQNFAHILADADGGTLNEQIGRKFADLMGSLNDRAFEYDETVTGEITVKLKVTVAGKSGKTEVVPACTVKKPADKMPRASFFQDADCNLTRQDPRAAENLFARKGSKAADPPKMANGQ